MPARKQDGKSRQCDFAICGNTVSPAQFKIVFSNCCGDFKLCVETFLPLRMSFSCKSVYEYDPACCIRLRFRIFLSVLDFVRWGRGFGSATLAGLDHGELTRSPPPGQTLPYCVAYKEPTFCPGMSGVRTPPRRTMSPTCIG